MMQNSAVCKYSFVWEQVLTVSAGEVQEWQFQCFSAHKCNEHPFVPSLLIKRSTVIIFASSRIGRRALERHREAIPRWPGKMRLAQETGIRGQLSPTKCKCLQCQRGKKSEKNNGSVTVMVLKINVRFPPHFRQVSSQLSHLLFFKYL